MINILTDPLCFAFNRSPMTCHGVTQRGPMLTRFSPTTTSLILTPILILTTTMPDTTGCLRTSLAKANQCFLSWWQQKIRAVCVETNNRPLAFPSLLCCHQWKATAKVKHQTCAANKPLVRTVCRHKTDTAFSPFLFFFFLLYLSLCLWMGSHSTSPRFMLWFKTLFRTNFLVHDHYEGTRGGLHVTLIQFIFQKKKEIRKKKDLFIQLASQIFFPVCILPCMSLETVSLTSRRTQCTISSHLHNILCNYLKRYYYMFYIVYKMTIIQ